MAISVDVLLVSTVRQRPDVSAVVELTGSLGSTRASGTLSAVVEPSGSLSGGRLAMSGSVSAVVEPSGSGNRLLMITEDSTSPYDALSYYSYPWYVETDGANVYYENVEHPLDTAVEDFYGVTPSFLEVSPSSTLTIVPVLAPVVPSFPATPAPPDESGDYPLPAAGGMIVRALPGIAVQVDTPVIVDGRPT
jgi:hypothetical protein